MFFLLKNKFVLFVAVFVFATVMSFSRAQNQTHPKELSPKPTPPSSFVLQHHNLVKEQRLEFLKHIATIRPVPQTIIVLSPDHFSQNQKQLTFANKTWQLSNGSVSFDANIGPAVTAGLQLDNDRATQDHGVFNILPDLHTIWPDADVVPILLGQELEFSELHSLNQQIHQLCQPETCILIGSVDFSHYLPQVLADIHDTETVKALTTLQLNSPKQIEVDSPQALYLLMQHASAQKKQSFTLYAHTNSGEITKTPDVESTSHIMGWYDVGDAPERENEHDTFLFAKNIFPENERSGLGERVFYGTEILDANLSKSVQLTPYVSITPSTQPTALNFSEETKQFTIEVGEDAVVAGFQTPDKVYAVILPIKAENDHHIFLRDQEKKAALAQIAARSRLPAEYPLNQQTGVIVLIKKQ